MEFKTGDIIHYTCGRIRILLEKCNSGFESTFNGVHGNVSPVTLNHQIENGDILLVSRSGEAVYAKDSSFPKLKSGYRIVLRSGTTFLLYYNNGCYYGVTRDGSYLNLSKWYLRGGSYQNTSSLSEKGDIVRVYCTTEGAPLDLDDVDLIWAEPQTIELTLEDIAKKFGIAVTQLKIKK